MAIRTQFLTVLCFCSGGSVQFDRWLTALLIDVALETLSDDV